VWGGEKTASTWTRRSQPITDAGYYKGATTDCSMMGKAGDIFITRPRLPTPALRGLHTLVFHWCYWQMKPMSITDAQWMNQQENSCTITVLYNLLLTMTMKNIPSKWNLPSIVFISQKNIISVVLP
jgi:hypothetical protein